MLYVRDTIAEIWVQDLRTNQNDAIRKPVHSSRLGVTARTRTSSQPYYFPTVLSVVPALQIPICAQYVAEHDLELNPQFPTPVVLLKLKQRPLQLAGAFPATSPSRNRSMSDPSCLCTSHPASHRQRWSLCQFQIQGQSWIALKPSASSS